MFFYEGLSCPVCGKPFSDGEDIVACPTCGAPHHRACWMEEGHCHFADRHGTAEQWSRESVSTTEPQTGTDEQRRCPHCGAQNSPFAEFCGHCGRPIVGQSWQSGNAPTPPPPTFREYAPYRIPTPDRFGGVNKDTLIDDVSAEDVAAVVGKNATYYLPRFEKMANKTRRVQFNWMAFLFTPYWLMFRKNYLFGLFVLAFGLINTALTTYVQVVKLGLGSLSSADAIYDRIYNALNSGGPLAKYVYLIAGLSLLSFLLSLVFGLFGNYLYMQTCLSRVRKLKEQSPLDYKTQLPAVGGVSAGLLILTVFINYFGPSLIELLISYFK